MGTKIGRIEQEFILNNLVEKSIPLELQVRKLNIEGVLLSVENDILVFSSSSSDLNSIQHGEKATVLFSLYSNTMTAACRVIKEGNPVHLKMENGVYKNLKRKYVRVNPDRDIALTFTLENARVILDFPRTREYEAFDSEIFGDKFDFSSIESLLSDFKKKASRISSENKIVMFRSRRPESFEERLITDTGKCLYLPDTELGKLPGKKSSVSHLAVTEEYFLNRDGTEKEYLGKTLRQVDKLVREKFENKIYAEIYCPVIYHEYVVGYVYLCNEKNRTVRFEEEDLAFCKEFTRFLAYVLERNGYFANKKEVESEFSPAIIDISASGLLFTHPEKKLSELLGLYGDIKLTLRVGQRKMNILSRIMRKYEYKGQFFYGIQFLEIAPEDFRFLFEYVYGRSFTEQDDRLWEGGAAPPDLEF